MTRRQISTMSDVEVRLRLENTRLRIKVVDMRMREGGWGDRFSGLIAKKNRLRTQEKKWRLELDRRERTSQRP